jgi:group I intron endonuclease
MKIQFIYALICPDENQIKYIGKTTDLTIRLKGHINYALRKTHLNGKHEWIRNLHSRGLKPQMIIIEQCDNDNWQERESYWIDFYSKKLILFNKTNGGEDFVFKSGNTPWNQGGGKFSDESRQKMSDSHTGKIITEEQKSKTSAALLGKPKTSEHAMNIRVGLSKKSVLQFDLEDNLIKEHINCAFAAEEMGCKRESIRDACNGRMKKCKGFKWKYK